MCACNPSAERQRQGFLGVVVSQPSLTGKLQANERWYLKNQSAQCLMNNARVWLLASTDTCAQLHMERKNISNMIALMSDNAFGFNAEDYKTVLVVYIF